MAPAAAATAATTKRRQITTEKPHSFAALLHALQAQTQTGAGGEGEGSAVKGAKAIEH